MKNTDAPCFSTYYDSPVGRLLLGATDTALIGLWLQGQKYFGGGIADKLAENTDLPVFSQTRQWLDAYFNKEKPKISDLNIAPFGTVFQQKVWHILREIPYGNYTTYGAIAKKLAADMNRKTMSSQAVGGAVSHNPISIIIPCHRVVGSNKNLTGYAGGISIKMKLLELEGIDPSIFSVPKN